MAVDAQNPIDVVGDLGGEIAQGGGEADDLLAAGPGHLRRARREQHFRLEDETVADDADVGAVAEHVAQTAEKLGAVARQFLDFAGERQVEAATEIDDLHVLFFGFGLGGGERLFDAGHLLAQRGNLVVKQLHLGLRRDQFAGRLLGLAGLGREIASQLVALGAHGFDLALQAGDFGELGLDSGAIRLDGLEGVGQFLGDAVGLAGAAFGLRQPQRQAVALAGRFLQLIGELAERQAHVGAVLLFQRQQFRELGQLTLQACQRLIAARQHVGEEELAEHEHGQHEHDDHQQGRERVDEPRPDVGDRAAAIAAGEGHGGLPALHQRAGGGVLSRGKAAIVRERILISLRISSTVWLRPWLISSINLAR